MTQISEFDPLPIAYAAGFTAMGLGIINNSEVAGIEGLGVLVLSRIAQIANFERPQNPRKKKNDK